MNVIPCPVQAVTFANRFRCSLRELGIGVQRGDLYGVRRRSGIVRRQCQIRKFEITGSGLLLGFVQFDLKVPVSELLITIFVYWGFSFLFVAMFFSL